MDENQNLEKQNPETETPIIFAAPKRNWSSYIKEFIMLFLAVFCGFLAENYRTYLSERSQEKQYLTSLVEELIQDTTMFNIEIQYIKENMKKADTLIDLLVSPDIRLYGSDVYYLGRTVSRNNALVIHNKTIQQMTNSGGFRMIQSRNLSNEILAYYNSLVFIEHLHNVEREEVSKYRELAISVFHPKTFDAVVKPDNSIIRPSGNPALLSYKPEQLIPIAGMLAYIKGARKTLSINYLQMKADAIKLIQLLKKEISE